MYFFYHGSNVKNYNWIPLFCFLQTFHVHQYLKKKKLQGPFCNVPKIQGLKNQSQSIQTPPA